MKSVRFLRKKNSILSVFSRKINQLLVLEQKIEKESDLKKKKLAEIENELQALKKVQIESSNLRKKFEDFVVVK